MCVKKYRRTSGRKTHKQIFGARERDSARARERERERERERARTWTDAQEEDTQVHFTRRPAVCVHVCAYEGGVWGRNVKVWKVRRRSTCRQTLRFQEEEVEHEEIERTRVCDTCLSISLSVSVSLSLCLFLCASALRVRLCVCVPTPNVFNTILVFKKKRTFGGVFAHSLQFSLELSRKRQNCPPPVRHHPVMYGFEKLVLYTCVFVCVCTHTHTSSVCVCVYTHTHIHNTHREKERQR